MRPRLTRDLGPFVTLRGFGGLQSGQAVSRVLPTPEKGGAPSSPWRRRKGTRCLQGELKALLASWPEEPRPGGEKLTRFSAGEIGLPRIGWYTRLPGVEKGRPGRARQPDRAYPASTAPECRRGGHAEVLRRRGACPPAAVGLIRHVRAHYRQRDEVSQGETRVFRSR